MFQFEVFWGTKPPKAARGDGTGGNYSLYIMRLIKHACYTLWTQLIQIRSKNFFTETRKIFQNPRLFYKYVCMCG